MPVAATSTIGANPYFNPSLSDFAQVPGEAGRPEVKNSVDAEIASSSDLEAAIIDLKSALSLTDQVTAGLKSKPDWMALRLHSPLNPSLLGKNYV